MQKHYFIAYKYRTGAYYLHLRYRYSIFLSVSALKVFSVFSLKKLTLQMRFSS